MNIRIWKEGMLVIDMVDPQARMTREAKVEVVAKAGAKVVAETGEVEKAEAKGPLRPELLTSTKLKRQRKSHDLCLTTSGVQLKDWNLTVLWIDFLLRLPKLHLYPFHLVLCLTIRNHMLCEHVTNAGCRFIEFLLV
jgi:hypothetical protein